MKKERCWSRLASTSVLITLFLTLSPQAQRDRYLQTRYLQKMDDVKAAGGTYFVHWLPARQLFGQSTNAEAISLSAKETHLGILDEITDRDLTPIATTTSLVLPVFAEAPTLPNLEQTSRGSAERVKLSCVPPIGSSEYLRLLDLRGRIYATLAREFSSISHWMIGNEANAEFYDCSGNGLALDDYITFVVDTLKEGTAAIKSQNPSTIVIAHFLRRRDIPIVIEGQLVQPTEFVGLILGEIRQRGDAPTRYFDILASDIDPALLADRQPYTPAFFSASGPSRLHAAEWNEDSGWTDEFDTSDTSDLVGCMAVWPPI